MISGTVYFSDSPYLLTQAEVIITMVTRHNASQSAIDIESINV